MSKRLMYRLLSFVIAFYAYFILVMKDVTGLAKVTGPLMSMSASGTIGDALTYLTWKGIEVCRQWFVPSNPRSATQTNVRTALTICVASWQAQIVGDKALWDTFAEGTQMSGFNQYVGRAMAQYVIQLGTAVTPASVSYDHPAPGETWVWVAVV